MIGRVDEVVIDCADPGLLGRFWADVLGGEHRVRDDDWHTLRSPGSPDLAFQRVPEGKTVKNRLHLDVLVEDIEVGTAQAEALGAVRQGDVHHDVAGSFQVLLDPEGNEWCVVRSNA
ncbi:VOC family protein [Cellulomonas sp. NS3]|uniref:VOC family protein n=1 Tax=Cellulomonas sp. NS3 TaxID=2973977 RepID=UPI002161FFB2|nr:VOC family protein [Cellulomonas sp. NS3]